MYWVVTPENPETAQLEMMIKSQNKETSLFVSTVHIKAFKKAMCNAIFEPTLENVHLLALTAVLEPHKTPSCSNTFVHTQERSHLPAICVIIVDLGK